MLAARTTPAAEPKAWSQPVPGPGMDWREIAEPIAPFLAEVRAFIESQIETFEPEVIPGARYAFSASGKQLRPVLVALSAQAAGALGSPHVTAAAIVELVHLATLVHDDVIDAAGVRRRLPTVAARFGNQTAVLLGDCLFAHALKLAAGFPTPEVCGVVAGATKAVCSGEILQTLRRTSWDLPFEDYFRIIQLKTAELFALACELGALLAEPPQVVRKAVREFGLAFGSAYQMFDDCLDLLGEEESAGKTLGTDLASGKVTLPLILAHQVASPAERAVLEGGAGREPERHLDQAAVRSMLARHGIAERCRAMIEDHLQAARDALRPVDGAPETQALLALTRYLGKLTSRLTRT